MKLRALTVLACSVAASISTFAGAAGFAGNVVVAAVARPVANMTQPTSSALFPTLPVRVTLCSGVVEAPVFVILSPTIAEAVGSCYRLRATVMSANQTRFQIWHSGAAGGVIRFDMGGGAQNLVFDRTNPNPGTAGSLTGRDVGYIGGNGPWVATAEWRNPISLPGAGPVGDAYSSLAIRFSTCFTANNYLYFDVDTDKAN